MRRLSLAMLLACAACGFGNDVEQDGNYTIVPSTRVTDSAPYPLRHLLIVEEDVAIGQTRVYFFTGELSRADLGLEDLRRIALRHGRAQMAFDPPRERIDLDEIQTRNRPLPARAGDADIELKRLDDTGLRATGAVRYLAYALSPDYDVAAYFTVLDDFAPLEIERRDVEFEPLVGEPELRAEEREDGDSIALAYDTEADYVVVELSQRIVRKVDEDAMEAEPEELDALVRTSLAPEVPYVFGEALITDVAGQGCWSREQTIEARLTQVARRYQPRSSGDWAAIHFRYDAVEIGVDRWTRLLGEPTVPRYCDEFE